MMKEAGKELKRIFAWRNERIFAMSKVGKSKAEIARIHCISSTRVGQILAKIEKKQDRSVDKRIVDRS